MAEFTDGDKAEHKLFNELEGNYDQNCNNLNGPRGYKTFTILWDNFVANSHKRRIEGEEATLITRKSYTQLQDHFDTLKKQKDLLSLASKTDAGNKHVENVFRETRQEMAATPFQDVHTCQPMQYPLFGRAVFGVPVALNTGIALSRQTLVTDHRSCTNNISKRQQTQQGER